MSRRVRDAKYGGNYLRIASWDLLWQALVGMCFLSECRKYVSVRSCYVNWFTLGLRQKW